MAIKITIVGLIGTIPYHKALFCAQDLEEALPNQFEASEITGYLEFEWNQYITSKIRELRGELWAFEETAIVFLNNEYLGTSDEFIQWAITNHNFEDFRPMALYLTLAEDSYKSELERRNHDFAFLEIAIDDDVIGRLVIELFTDTVPKTCDNFLSLCTGERGNSKHNEVEEFKLCYKDSIFHRTVPNGWIQGGDIWYGKGNGGESIYGSTFEDESFAIPHNQRGVVSMANKGRHSNGSQFFFTLSPAPWMDTKFVAFGHIIEGTDVLKRMESERTINERPMHSIKIVDCGRYEY